MNKEELIKFCKEQRQNAFERLNAWDEQGDLEMSGYFNGMAKAFHTIQEMIENDK